VSAAGALIPAGGSVSAEHSLQQTHIHPMQQVDFFDAD
jgi:hypothetical protein